MNRTAVLGAFCLSLCLPALLPSASAATPAGFAINHVIDDASWIATTGRDPTDSDDGHERVAAHLAYVEGILRQATTDHLSPSQRQARAQHLDELGRYRLAGQFPQHTFGSPDGTSHRPRFIDDQGRHCAVGHLIAASGGADIAKEINTEFEYAYLKTIADADPRVASWANVAGLTLTELAMIQPSYNWRKPMPVRPSRPPFWRFLVNGQPTTLVPAVVSDDKLSGPRDRKGRPHGVWVERRVFPANSPKVQPRCVGALSPRPTCPTLVRRVVFRHGKRHGPEVQFDLSGRPVLRGQWSRNRRVGEWVQSRTGMVVTHSYDRQGRLHGAYEARDPRRNVVMTRGKFAHGKRVGTWSIRSRRAVTLVAVGRYRKNLRVGLWKLFQKKGKGVRTAVATVRFRPNGSVEEFKQIRR